METGTVFWAVVAYSLLAPIIVRWTLTPLAGEIITREMIRRYQADPDLIHQRSFLLRVAALASIPTILAGPWAWGRSVSRIIEAQEEFKKSDSKGDRF